jgi:hypothetical protein
MTTEYANWDDLAYGVTAVQVPCSHGRSPWQAPYDGLARTRGHVRRLVEWVEQSL